MIAILEYIGTAFVVTGQWVRSTPKYTSISLMLSVVGSIIFIPYSIMTHQWGYLLLNVMSVIAGIRGIKAWKHKKVVED
jgi:hypothetical protein